MAIYGYARASTLEQNVTIQEDALRRAGCEVIRSEKVSGSSRAGRSELALLLQFLRRGDTLMVTRVDRLARSIKDLQDIVHELRAAGVTLRATEQPIDTSSAAGRRSSTCSACLPNSRPICVENGKWKGSLKRRPRVSTPGASRRLILRRFGVFGPKKNLGQPRLPNGSALVGPRYTGCLPATTRADAGKFPHARARAALRAVSGRGFRRTIGPIFSSR